MPWKPATHWERTQKQKRKAADKQYLVGLKDRPDQLKARKIRSSARWQRLRAWMLRRNPLCQDPYQIHKKLGETMHAEEVHHIVPIAERLELAFEETNLLCLCVKCHAAVEARRRKS